MNADLLFEAMGEIDERFFLEAAEDTIPHRGWKIAAVAAAAAAVIAGSVWFSNGLFRPPDQTPIELAAPIVTSLPTVPPETGQIPYGTDLTGESERPQAPAPEEPTPNRPEAPDFGSGASGSGMPQMGFGLPGFGQNSSGSGLPGNSNSASGLPGPGGVAAPSYRVEYRQSDAGDDLVLYSPLLGVPVMTKNITGQIVDGFYAGTFSGLPFGQTVYVELQVYEDGSYDLRY